MTFLEELQQRLQLPLPGQEAQYKMAHGIRRHVPAPPPDVRIASVLITLFPHQEEWHTLLIQRTGNDIRDKHKGQISFPGGKQEPEDPDLQATALREAYEEVGLAPEKVQPLGRLTQLYIPVSNFIVHPFIGAVAEKPNWVPQPTEVAGLIEVPISALINPGNHRTKDLSLGQHMTLKRVPYYAVEDQVVWGATAMIISELLEVLPQPVPTP